MSISSTRDEHSSEIDHISEEKNIPSPTLSFGGSYQNLPSELSLNFDEKSKNYQKKNGSREFKIKSENESVAYIKPQPIGCQPFSPYCHNRANQPLIFQNLSGDSKYLKANQF